MFRLFFTLIPSIQWYKLKHTLKISILEALFFFFLSVPQQKQLPTVIVGDLPLSQLSIESLIEAIGIDGDKLCLGCINEDYPTEIPDDLEAESYYDYYQPLRDAAEEDE